MYEHTERKRTCVQIKSHVFKLTHLHICTMKKEVFISPVHKHFASNIERKTLNVNK